MQYMYDDVPFFIRHDRCSVIPSMYGQNKTPPIAGCCINTPGRINIDIEKN